MAEPSPLEIINSLLQTGMKAWNDVQDVDLANQKLIAAQNAIEIKGMQAEYLADERADLTVRKKYLTEQREDYDVAIKDLKDNILKYDTTAEKYSKVDDYFRSPEGVELFEQLGVEYGEDFAFTEKIDKDHEQQLLNTEGLLQIQKFAADELGKEYAVLRSLKEDFAQVKDDATVGIVLGEIDYNDQIMYVNEHPEKFAANAIFEDILDKEGEVAGKKLIEDSVTLTENFVPFGKYPEGHPRAGQFTGTKTGGNLFELNELAKAFLSEKSIYDGVEYGFRDQKRVDALVAQELNLAALGRKAKVTQDKEDLDAWNQGVGRFFKDLAMTENNIVTIGTGTDIITKTGGKIQTLKAGVTSYETKEGAKELKAEIRDKIIRIMSWDDRGTMGEQSWFNPFSALRHMNEGTGSIREKIHTVKGKGTSEEIENDVILKLYEKIMPDSDTNIKYGSGDVKFWKDADMANIDLAGPNNKQITEEEYLFKLFEGFNMLEQKYPGVN